MIKSIFIFLQGGSPFFIRPLIGVISAALNKGFLNGELAAQWSYLEQALEGKDYFLATKNPTRVDFCMLWYADQAFYMDQSDFNSRPNLKRWRERCQEREAWKRALAKCNGYDLGKLAG